MPQFWGPARRVGKRAILTLLESFGPPAEAIRVPPTESWRCGGLCCRRGDWGPQAGHFWPPAAAWVEQYCSALDLGTVLGLHHPQPLGLGDSVPQSWLTGRQAQPLNHVRPEGWSIGPSSSASFCFWVCHVPPAALGRSHVAERPGFKGEIPSVVCPPMGPVASFSLLPLALVGLQPSLEGPHLDSPLPGCQDPTLARSLLWAGYLAPRHPQPATAEWVMGCFAFLEASWCPGCIMGGLRPAGSGSTLFPIGEMGLSAPCSSSQPAAQNSKLTAPLKPPA